MRILWRSISDFFRHDGPMLAGSVTFFSIMALVPFLLLLVSLFGYLLGEHEAFYEFLSAWLAGFFPKATEEITEELGKLIAYNKIGLFTLAVYAYFSYQLYFSLERAVDRIFGSGGKRSLFVSLMLSLIGITALMVVMIIGFGAASLISLFDPLARFFPGLRGGETASLFIGVVLPVTLVFAAASAFYMALPERKVMLRHALCGALFTALLTEAANHIFTYYAVMKVSQFGNIYGPLTAFVMFLLWVFSVACIFLMGAEIVRNLELEHGHAKKPTSRP